MYPQVQYIKYLFILNPSIANIPPCQEKIKRFLKINLLLDILYSSCIMGVINKWSYYG